MDQDSVDGSRLGRRASVRERSVRLRATRVVVSTSELHRGNALDLSELAGLT